MREEGENCARKTRIFSSPASSLSLLLFSLAHSTLHLAFALIPLPAMTRQYFAIFYTRRPCTAAAGLNWETRRASRESKEGYNDIMVRWSFCEEKGAKKETKTCDDMAHQRRAVVVVESEMRNRKRKMKTTSERETRERASEREFSLLFFRWTR